MMLVDKLRQSLGIFAESETVTCLVLHSTGEVWHGRKEALAWVEVQRKTFHSLGCRPNRMSIQTRSQFARGVRGRDGGFDRVLSRLQSEKEEVGAIELFLETRKRSLAIESGYLVASLLLVEQGISVIAADRKLVSLDENFAMRICKEENSCRQFCYGYGYSSPRSMGPRLFAMGMGLGSAPMSSRLEREKALQTSRWSRALQAMTNCGEFDFSALRDVFPMNILSSRHLAIEVDGRSLAKWIAEDPTQRGKLQTLNDNALWLWALPESSIATVREKLTAANVLWAYREGGHLAG